MVSEQLLRECLEIIVYQETQVVVSTLLDAYFETVRTLPNKKPDELLDNFLGSMRSEMMANRFPRKELPFSFIQPNKTEDELLQEIKQKLKIKDPVKTLNLYGALGGAYVRSVPVEIFNCWRNGVGEGLGTHDLKMSIEEEIDYWWGYWWFYTWLGY